MRGPRKLASLKQCAALIRLKLRSSARAEGVNSNAPWRVLVWGGASAEIAWMGQVGMIIGWGLR